MGLFTRIFNIPNYINVYKKFDDLLFHRVDFYPDAVNHQPNRHTDIFPASPQHGSTVGTLRINKLLTKKGKPGEVKRHKTAASDGTARDLFIYFFGGKLWGLSYRIRRGSGPLDHFHPKT